MKHQTMKACVGGEVYLQQFLTSVLSAGEWSASLTGRFSSEERPHGTDSEGDWVDPTIELDTL